jgi:hypothetical protein
VTLSIIGYQEVTSPLGSALAFSSAGKLAMVSYNLYEFITTPATATTVPAPTDENPERLPDELEPCSSPIYAVSP